VDGDPLDLERESNDHGSLSLLLQVDQPPPVPFLVAMRDADGNTAQIDVTPAMQNLNDWDRLRISLHCFAERGVNMQSVSTPLELYTTGAAQVVLADVRLATAAEGDSFCPD
jgi:beta-glucosidase